MWTIFISALSDSSALPLTILRNTHSSSSNSGSHLKLVHAPHFLRLLPDEIWSMGGHERTLAYTKVSGVQMWRWVGVLVDSHRMT